MAVKLLRDVVCQGKTVAIRQDLNVPMKDGVITNDKRIRAALPGVRMALEKGAAGVTLLSHLGRPVEGEFDPKFSLAPVAAHLASLLGEKVRLAATPEEARPAPGEIVLLENVRFLKGEKKNDPALAARFAALGDIYVMDAFGAAHRAHASTEGAVRRAGIACAGPLMAAELEAFGKVLHAPARPLAAVIGGSKVSSKLGLLENLVDRVDILIVGGGIANTFLAASGAGVGASLHEPDLLEEARKIMAKAAAQGKALPLPVDVVTARALEPGQKSAVHPVSDVPTDEMILDIGPRTVALYEETLGRAATVVWNGPVGAFEVEPFGDGTRALASALAASTAFVVVGGGDSVAALERYGLADRMGYVSTGGGASLELLEGRTLPSVAALEARCQA